MTQPNPTARAGRGDEINPRDALRCAACYEQLGLLAIHHQPGDSLDVLCTRCVARPSLHRRYWPQCHNNTHDLFSHVLHYRRRATALALIKERSTR